MAKDSFNKTEYKNTQNPANDDILVVPLAGSDTLTVGNDSIASEGTASSRSPAFIPSAEEGADSTASGERRELVKSAGLVTLGNLGSSVMGMVRQIVVASLGHQVASAFQSALLPAQTFNDFLINGSVAGALVPTFNDYVATDKREELRRLVFTIVNLVFLVMLAASLIFLLIAPQFINFIVGGYQQADRQLTLNFARIIFFSLIALGPFSVLLAALYAMKEFGWPAFATAAYHVGIIIGAIVGSLLGERYLGNYGLAVGVLVGTIGEIALLIPGMRNQRFRYLLVLDLKHPALRRILKLYAPIAFSYLITMFMVFLDQYLTARASCNLYVTGVHDCGEANFSAMRFATTLYQFPIGLVALALSTAVLPTLTTHAREGNLDRFKDTLLLGFRLGLLLMIPAMTGLIVLQYPIVNLIFKHHNFTPQDATLTALSLQNYAYQLPFIVLDQLMIAAFYARKNTIIPVTVMFAGIAGYLLVALPFGHTYGAPALAFANTVQNSVHALVLLVILRFKMGSLHIRKTLPTILKIIVATAIMGLVAWWLQSIFAHIPLFSLDHFIGQLLTVLLAGGAAVIVYALALSLLKVEEVNLLKGVVLAKLGKR